MLKMPRINRELKRIIKAAQFARQAGLVVNAGHGLNYQNVQAIAAIPEMNELNIGHGIVARAIFIGLEQAVREMKRLMIASENFFMTIRTRFSPSPTGMMHLGNARAALFSALYAKKNKAHLF